MRRLLLASVLLASACSQAGAADRAFPVGGFNRIETSGPWDVRVHTGAAPSVRAHGSAETLDRLRVEVQGGLLTIGSKQGRWFSGWNLGGQRLVVDVTVPGLIAASLAGPGNLGIDRVRAPNFTASLSGPGNLTIGALETGHLDATLSGPGDLSVTGRAASAGLTLSGPGDIRATGLSVRDATLALRGPGNIALTATGEVSGTLSGPGDITIRGGARCAITRHGPGDVTCR